MILADNLYKYIDDDSLLTLNISMIYRIIINNTIIRYQVELFYFLRYLLFLHWQRICI